MMYLVVAGDADSSPSTYRRNRDPRRDSNR